MRNIAKIAKCVLLILVIVSAPACKKMPFYALAGTILNVSADKTFLKTGGDKATITVIGINADGEPLHDHTQIDFTATLGTIPASTEMISGRAVVEFISGDRDGVAEIVVRSGSITATSTNIFIGSGALETLTLHASPAQLGAGGGLALITVYAFDKANNPLADIPVILSASAGELDRGNAIRLTDSNGMVSEYLYTEENATVSAESGSVSATDIEVKVKENQPPSADFSISPSSGSIDETIYFNGNISTDTDGHIVNWEWDFGDGKSGHGEKTTHAYAKAGTYTVTLKVTDNARGSDFLQKPIIIGEK